MYPVMASQYRSGLAPVWSGDVRQRLWPRVNLFLYTREEEKKRQVVRFAKGWSQERSLSRFTTAASVLHNPITSVSW